MLCVSHFTYEKIELQDYYALLKICYYCTLQWSAHEWKVTLSWRSWGINNAIVSWKEIGKPPWENPGFSWKPVHSISQICRCCHAVGGPRHLGLHRYMFCIFYAGKLRGCPFPPPHPPHVTSTLLWALHPHGFRPWAPLSSGSWLGLANREGDQPCRKPTGDKAM